MKSCIILDLENKKKNRFFPEQLQCLELHAWKPPLHSCYISFECQNERQLTNKGRQSNHNLQLD